MGPAGLLAPLDPFFNSKSIDVSNVVKSILDSGTVDGKVYGLSLGTNSQSFILDVDAFEKAGVDLPATDWTRKDFEDIAMQLHEKLGIWAMSYGPEDVQIWKSLYLGAGANAFSPDGTAFRELLETSAKLVLYILWLQSECFWSQSRSCSVVRCCLLCFCC